MLQMTRAFAEFERVTIQARIHASLIAAADGAKLRRPLNDQLRLIAGQSLLAFSNGTVQRIKGETDVPTRAAFLITGDYRRSASPR
jgi:DNA invertase Pin-like site-specific DNA recombinase